MKKKFDARNLVHTPAEMMSEVVGWSERIRKEPGIQFGIPMIDKVLIPIRAGNLVTIIARPGNAKTSLLVFLARQEAARILERGKEREECVLYVTWEQTSEELTAMLMARPEMNLGDIVWGRADIDAIKRAAVKGARTPVWIIGHGISRTALNVPRMTPDLVLEAIESMYEDFKIRPTLMLFDYLQLIPTQRAQDRVQQVTEMPIRLKELAMRVGAPAIAGVQASREVDSQEIKIPEARHAQWACVAGDAKIMNAKTGAIVDAESLWRLHSITGESFTVHALDEENLKIENSARIVAAKQNPPQQIYRIECGNYGSVRVSEDHKFYTPDGWKKASDLKRRDWIALANHLPTRIAYSDITPSRAYILGLILGDGTVTRSMMLSNGDSEIMQSYVDAVKREWPGYTVSLRKQTEWDVWDGTAKRKDGRVFPGCSEPLNWLREIGVFGQTAESKHVPDLALTTAEICELLAGLFVTDGSVTFRNDTPQITFCSVSEQLVLDVRSLLLRIGIVSTVRVQASKSKNRRDIFCLKVAAVDMLSFHELVNLRGKKGRLLDDFFMAHQELRGRSQGDLLPHQWNTRAIEILKERHLRTEYNNVKGRAITRGRMLRIARDTNSKELMNYALCSLRWERVTAIVPDGIEPTYDFMVSDYENFVVNGFVTHNSSIEQTSDRILSLWRPALTEGTDSVVEIGKKKLKVTENLLIIRMLKQRGDVGRHTWATYFDPALMRLAELETHNNKADIDF